MKIIRPTYIPPKPKQKPEINDDTLIDDDISQLMEETINENRIKVEITLTKKQYDKWQKNGADIWLKTMLSKQ